MTIFQVVAPPSALHESADDEASTWESRADRARGPLNAHVLFPDALTRGSMRPEPDISRSRVPL